MRGGVRAGTRGRLVRNCSGRSSQYVLLIIEEKFRVKLSAWYFPVPSLLFGQLQWIMRGAGFDLRVVDGGSPNSCL
ncbi:hypothetical protein D9M68_448900 [compost metagenome]